MSLDIIDFCYIMFGKADRFATVHGCWLKRRLGRYCFLKIKGLYRNDAMKKIWFLLLLVIVITSTVWAEDGYDVWLRYRPLGNSKLLQSYRANATGIVLGQTSPTLNAAAEELSRGLSGLLDKEFQTTARPVSDGAVILLTSKQPKIKAALRAKLEKLGPEGYTISRQVVDGKKATVIASKTDRGVLYGAFHFLRLLQTEQCIENLNIEESPRNSLRQVNHWDNPGTGTAPFFTVERGYAGTSIFNWDKLPELNQRYTDYARMLASVGINGCIVNNVNTAKKGLVGWKLITEPYLKKAVALAGVFRQYGVKLYVSVNFASPMLIDGFDTADPLDPKVQQWWKDKADEIYRYIPDFGGFLVKADSEGEPGPYTYGRNHAIGANMLGRALAPHGGLVMWRAFVYGHKNIDRAMQAYTSFKPYDGQFEENVIIQIKNGPMDFQVREPVSSLFGQMPKTNLMLELQITQEYTGYSTHLCYLIPQWKYFFDFDTQAKGASSTLDKVVDGSLHGYKHSGIAGVANIGSDRNWTGHHLAQANTYGYGRLAWNPGLSSEEITDEWVKMTYGSDPKVVDTISKMLLDSFQIYEDYTSPLGVGFMCGSKKPHRHHYDPDPAGRQKKYHHADKQGVGYDRTKATGSGYTMQYHKVAADIFESLETCPDELLLFFHHVPYRHRLHSGKTVIQHIYDTHNDGAKRAEGLRKSWKSLKGKIDKERFAHVLGRLNKQIDHAYLWRDTINGYFEEMSGIPNEKKN